MADTAIRPMRVKLIDIDNKYREKSKRGLRWQNLALMKISTYEKAMGNEVGFEIQILIKLISPVFSRSTG